MLRVGLTGGAAAGKSTVARRLSERGIPVIDADREAHALYAPGTELCRALVEAFGGEVAAEDGGIDRGALGRIVFADPARREALNALVHPPLIAALKARLRALAAEGHAAAVLDAALLLQWDAPDLVDLVVGVTAPRAVRRERLERAGLTPKDAERRVDAQVDDLTLAERSDLLILNNGTPEALEAQADALAEELLRRANTHRG
jgi:dephospho-CoA kinase